MMTIRPKYAVWCDVAKLLKGLCKSFMEGPIAPETVEPVTFNNK
jgi:hypothetical protein